MLKSVFGLSKQTYSLPNSPYCLQSQSGVVLTPGCTIHVIPYGSSWSQRFGVETSAFSPVHDGRQSRLTIELYKARPSNRDFSPDIGSKSHGC